ncbi:hypothetical protein E8E12_004772 [Didymella heteroderae]|uniref:Uncharacterized protein n=1 Tax=Didymella heteroderae TaxID=1769908 RepID=A0A9P4WI82_9PLEO|nr:hypothetical protein E8E12_004772 [Didymella heteroderae]
MFGNSYEPVHSEHLCGLYYNVPCRGRLRKSYLPQVEVVVHASILATTSRTKLQQTFQNPSTTRGIREVRYAFPLYDGMSVVGFQCHVGNRLIIGEVKEKENAKKVYKEAVDRGETAGLLEQLPEASDVFTTTIGNIPPGAKVTVDITYLGELKHDMEVDGIRFTIPTSICPRYGNVSDCPQNLGGTIAITVDAEMAQGSFIQRLQSPSHPISMSMGTTSVEPGATPSMSKASATLSLGVAHLDTDFVLQVIAKDTGIPTAILETHPTIPNQRALMATLVPKFALLPEKPEIVFVCDQSGSMGGSPMNLAKEALQVFLKSLPVGVKFNICSFGSRYDFLFPRSASYSQDTLATATRHAAGLSANYGGTEILEPLRATIDQRYKDMPLNIILLTDGEVWAQQVLFDYLNAQIQDTKAQIRVFTLGIGSGVSHSLIEGIAKAGNGFAQSVQAGEKMNSKVVRMLKAALSPHVDDYRLEVKYSSLPDSEFEAVERVADSLHVALDLNLLSLDTEIVSNEYYSSLRPRRPNAPKQPPRKISLYDTTSNLDSPLSSQSTDRFSHLPLIPAPKILQAPQSIPQLFAFNRTTVYLLLSSSAPRATPISVILRGTSSQGPLELEIPVHDCGKGETVHQLAAKKAVAELEMGRGWLACARASDASSREQSSKGGDGELLKEKFEGRFSDMVELEAVRLGVHFQVGGKWTSFVATERTVSQRRASKSQASGSDGDAAMDEDWEYLEVEEAAKMEPEYRREAEETRPRPSGTLSQARFIKPTKKAKPQMNKSLPRPAYGAAPAPGSSSLFGSSSTSNANALRDYQMGLMILHQDNPRRLRMAPAPSSCPDNAAATPYGISTPAPLASSSAFSPLAAPASASGASASYSPTSPSYSPTSPTAEEMQSESEPDEDMGFGCFDDTPPSRSPRFLTAEAEVIEDEITGEESSDEYGDLPTRQPRKRSKRNTFIDCEAEVDSDTSASDSDEAEEVQPDDLLVQHPRSPSSPPSPSYSRTSPSYSPASPITPTQTHSSQEILRLLIDNQSFSGAFPFHHRVLGWLGVSIIDFRQAQQDLAVSSSASDQKKSGHLLTTALVILYMEGKLVSYQDEWELVIAKARSWLEEQCMSKRGDAYLEAAAKLM